MGKLFKTSEARNLQPDDWKALQQRIGYVFQDESLLLRAFTHSSYANEQKVSGMQDYERLEFLGDAVLEIAASDYLYHRFPDLKEGALTKRRASMVCETALSHCARELEIGDCLLLGRGEEAAGGRDREALIADVMEAVTGAIYLDGGFDPAQSFVLHHILEKQDKLQLFYDSKTILQEIVQGRKLGQLSYRITGEKGPEHRRIFTCEVFVGDDLMGEGEGTSKKSAEQHAAYQALLKLGEGK
ncbi:MAG: ribonuclease III [Lachnospiraceae bacterium]|nr:ribonuclease III [Lachnospiraceae bacterium]